jgi:hypothetical protein
MKRVKLQLIVDYIPNGMTGDELSSCIGRALDTAVGQGLLTGNSPAEVESWSYEAKSEDVPDPQEEPPRNAPTHAK